MKSDVRLCGEEEVLLLHIIIVPIFIRLCNQAKDLELEPLKVGGSRQTSRVSPGSLPDLRPGVTRRHHSLNSHYRNRAGVNLMPPLSITAPRFLNQVVLPAPSPPPTPELQIALA